MINEDKEAVLRQVNNPALDYLKRKAIQKKVVLLSKKVSTCPHCGFLNGTVKKAVGAVLKIVHAEPVGEEKDFNIGNKDAKELGSLVTAIKFNLMDPLRVLNLFKKIAKEVRIKMYQ